MRCCCYVLLRCHHDVSIKRRGDVPLRRLGDVPSRRCWVGLSLEVFDVVLVQCNLVDNQYEQKPEVLYIFTPNKSYAYLLNVELSNLMLFKTYNTEFHDIIITFTDQSGRPLEIEDQVSLTLPINK